MKTYIIVASAAFGLFHPLATTAMSIGAKHLDIRQVADKVVACLPKDEREKHRTEIGVCFCEFQS